MGVNLKTGEEELSYDTHADSTITITNSSNSGKLEVGVNTISATTVCKDESGNALTINDIIVTICANTDGTYTYIVSGIGYDGEDYYTLDASGTVTTTKDPDNWPSNWSEYKFEGTTDGATGSDLYLDSDGTFWFGSEAMYPMKSLGAGTNGWWGYYDLESDGTAELLFVKKNGSGTYTYSVVEMSYSGNALTLGWLNGSQKPCVMTITDIGCLAGAQGYNLSTILVEGQYDTTTGVLTTA